MLKSLKVTSGYAVELEDLKDRTFKFPAGKINILYGPNGCGKTTILKMLAANTGLDHSAKNFGGGGWSGPPMRSILDELKFPGVFQKLTPGKCKANVEWDGVPAFYNSATLGDDLNMSYIVSGPEDSPDGLMDGREQLSLIMGHHSEGELRAYKLGKVLDAITKTTKPKPHIKPRKGATEIEKQYSNYVRGLRGSKKKCVYTLLWDEPDRSLSIDNQIKVWTNILPHILTEDLQIIIATHSAIIPLLPDFDFFNIIDVTKGYLDKSRMQLMHIMRSRLDDSGIKITQPMK